MKSASLSPSNVCVCSALTSNADQISLFEVIRICEYNKSHNGQMNEYETNTVEPNLIIYFYFVCIFTWICPLYFVFDALYDIQWMRDKITFGWNQRNAAVYCRCIQFRLYSMANVSMNENKVHSKKLMAMKRCANVIMMSRKTPQLDKCCMKREPTKYRWQYLNCFIRIIPFNSSACCIQFQPHKWETFFDITFEIQKKKKRNWFIHYYVLFAVECKLCVRSVFSPRKKQRRKPKCGISLRLSTNSCAENGTKRDWIMWKEKTKSEN